jgi:mono/diheme cytochrome c family protein
VSSARQATRRPWQLLGALMCVLGSAAPASAAEDPVIARGQAAFAHRCAMCHREGQTGAFILARRLGKDKSLLEQRTDLQPDYIRQIVRLGLVNMPRLSRVEMPDQDLDAVIAYLASGKAAQKGTP